MCVLWHCVCHWPTLAGMLHWSCLGACISDCMRNASPQSLPCQQSYIPAQESIVQPGTRLAIGCRAFAMPTTPARQARLAILWETRSAFRQQSKPNRISKMAPRCRAILPDSPRVYPILRDAPRCSPSLPDSPRFQNKSKTENGEIEPWSRADQAGPFGLKHLMPLGWRPTRSNGNGSSNVSGTTNTI